MKIVPTRIEQQINRVDRTRSLMIGISCGLLALRSIYRLLWSLYLAMTYNFLFGSQAIARDANDDLSARTAIEFVAIDSVKIANDALTKVRHRVPWDLRYRRDRRADPEWANRRRLMRARERLSDKSFAKMCNAIVSEDDTGQILSAWIAEEELLTLATTIDTRWPEMNALIATGITNARTEGYNRLVKQVKRAAPNSQHRNSARRIRFHCTGNQQAATQTSSLPGQNRR